MKLVDNEGSIAMPRPGLVGACGRTALRRAFSTVAAVADNVYTSEPGPSAPDLRPYCANRVRNFAIVAHVDHGKSTLADRLLQLVGVIESDAPSQFLDRLQVERQRGITVKSQVVSMFYRDPRSDDTYLLNLIDTPGHSDFSYEVHRSLEACQGVLLLIDANKGIESQTVTYFWRCLELPGLVIIPVINKIDIAAGKVPNLLGQLQKQFDFEADQCIKVSAKTGANVDAALCAIVDQVPGPSGAADGAIQGRVLDAWHLRYHGAVLMVSLQQGSLQRGSVVHFSRADHQAVVSHVGIMGKHPVPTDGLYAGQVGYCVCSPQRGLSLSALGDLVGDHIGAPGEEMAQGHYEQASLVRPQPALFVRLFPTEPQFYDSLNGEMLLFRSSQNSILGGPQNAVQRLHMNDTSVQLDATTSEAFGRGWRLGFVGLLHMQVFAERLANEHHEHEFVMARATVPYKVVLRPHVAKRYEGCSELIVEQPDQLPSRVDAESYLEPFCELLVTCPSEYTGAIMGLCNRRRAQYLRSEESSTGPDSSALHVFRAPLAEIIDDFGDDLKSVTAGYAKFEVGTTAYEYEPVDLVKLTILVNRERQPGFDVLVPRSSARSRGLDMIEKIAKRIPMHQFEVPIQAAIGSKIVARVNVAPYRNDFASKLKDNFSDRTRVAKLLKSQREGKARLKAKTSVKLPPAAYIDVFQR